MLTAALEDRFRETLGQRLTPEREGAVRFAVAFTQLIVRILPDEVPPAAIRPVAHAIEARTTLTAEELAQLLSLALSPEHRTSLDEEELAAFGARFGAAAESAMREAVADELDLEGFAARYGPAEALLLLDSLFSVSSVDGAIDAGEIAHLQTAARRLGLDPALVGLLFRKHDPRHAAGQLTYDLHDRLEVLIGREAPALVRLPDPQVATLHARLTRSTPSGPWRLDDLGSGRPTLLRGQAVASTPISAHAPFRVGPYTLALDDTEQRLKVRGTETVFSLSVRGLTRTIPRDGTRQTLLDDITFTVFSGEVVALLGPSGAGKTTLLQAIAGIAPADGGDVLLDRTSFADLLAADRSLVGVVPQEDVLHGELTVAETLRFAARLRLPADAPDAAVDEAVARVLAELGLEGVAGQRVGTTLQRGVSGGQRKRVNLGQELLTQATRVLFLDEPTSGLDPRTSHDIVTQARSLADDGRVIFLVTHDVSPSLLTLVDHLVVLAPGGRLAFFGPPREALQHFGVSAVDQIFTALPARAPEAWKAAYEASTAFRKYVRTRQHLLGLDEPTPRPPVEAPPRSAPWVQLATLTRRDALVRWRDRGGTAVLLGQAPVLALAFSMVFPAPQAGTLFVLMLSALWFGASASVRELIADRPIWQREARVGVGLLPYLAAKLIVLSAVVAAQVLLLTGTLHALLDLGAWGFDLFALSGVALGTGFVGITLGLLLSASFTSSEAAVGALPLVLIPQIAFGGLLVKIKEMSVAAKAVSWLMITRHAFEAALKTGEKVQRPGARGLVAAEERIGATLWDLGFRTTTSVDDAGLGPWSLSAIFAAFAACFLTLTAWQVHRARRGS